MKPPAKPGADPGAKRKPHVMIMRWGELIWDSAVDGDLTADGMTAKLNARPIDPRLRQNVGGLVGPPREPGEASGPRPVSRTPLDVFMDDYMPRWIRLYCRRAWRRPPEWRRRTVEAIVARLRSLGASRPEVLLGLADDRVFQGEPPRWPKSGQAERRRP